MKNARSFILAFIIILMSLPASAQIPSDEKLFEEAKILIFDKKWEAARDKLEELLDRYPESSFRDQAFFYRAKSLSEQPGREREAIEAYNHFVRQVRPTSRTASLVEDAEISIIDLAYSLYEKGQSSFLETIEGKLKNASKVVRYYAAFKLSYTKDKETAAKSVPILKSIIERERDAELKDRARIALLRISPDALKGFEEERTPSKVRLLKIQISEDGQKKFELAIPMVLADLALQAIPDEEKAKIRKKGYDLDRILNELAKSKSSILEINEDNSRIRIWVE